MTEPTGTLRLMVRGVYALQKLRIQTGLRLCANFRQKLKIEGEIDEDTEQPGELGTKAKEIIARLKAEYVRLTEGVARNRTLPKREGFVGSGVISDFAELALIHQYTSFEKQENEHFKQLGEALAAFKIYRDYLADEPGIGPALASVLIAYFDIHKAERPSQFWAYAGLDVGPDGYARSRRKAHLIEREYKTKSGETKTKMSTTFEPWLQSRLLAVLGGSLLRMGSPYRKYYDDYRHRIETDPARPKGTLLKKKNLIKEGKQDEADALWHPLRIHRASQRYMVKQMIADFWRRWREIEGLPVVPRYHEAVLGHKHHERSSNQRSPKQRSTAKPRPEAAE
jgi:hypothetical protein